MVPRALHKTILNILLDRSTMLNLLLVTDLLLFLQNQLESLSTESVVHLLLHAPVFPYVTAVHAYFITCKLRPNLKNQHWLFSMLTKYHQKFRF